MTIVLVDMVQICHVENEETSMLQPPPPPPLQMSVVTINRKKNFLCLSLKMAKISSVGGRLPSQQALRHFGQKTSVRKISPPANLPRKGPAEEVGGKVDLFWNNYLVPKLIIIKFPNNLVFNSTCSFCSNLCFGFQTDFIIMNPSSFKPRLSSGKLLHQTIV